MCKGPLRTRTSPHAAPRRSRYCSNACRQRSYRERRKVSELSTAANSAPLIHLSSFLGRADEMVEVGRLLQGGPLVTLTGPAGVGKTRLALEAAGQAQRARRLEAAVVQLRQVTRADEVRQRVMDTLGALTPATAGHAPGTGGAHRLLVLDDCEHLLDACGAVLAQLLPRVPGLKVLATSREPLRLPGEALLSVPGLDVPGLDVPGLAVPGRSVPGNEGEAALTDCLRSDAVRLFLDRARAVVPEFQMTEANAAQVGEVCKRLDGLPLALEMAARLMGVFPLSEILARLDDPLAVLTSGWRLADHRQQSLRASLAWGYDLLAPAEQSLFRRLSALPGGFGADGAAMLADPAGTEADVSGLLIALHAKSLIAPCAEQDGTARFRLAECTRYYGHERLVAEGEDAEAYERATAWLVSLSSPLQEQAVLHPATLRRLTEEHGNLLHLLGRGGAGTDERGLLLAGALAAVELSRGPSPQAGPLLSGVVSRTPHSSPYTSVALEGVAALAAWQGDLDTALRHAGQAVEVERRYGREPLLGRLLLLRGGLHARANARDGAVADLHECLAIGRRLHDETLTALCLSGFAWHQLQDGDLGPAEQTIVRVLPFLRSRVAPAQLRTTLVTAGMLALERDDPATAEAYFAESLRGCAGVPCGAAVAIEGLAVAAARASRFEKALRFLEAAARIGGGPSWGGPGWRERVQLARAEALRALPVGRAKAALEAGRAMRGGQVLAAATGSGSIAPASAADTPLSKREQDVVTLVVQGLSNRQIAARIHVSVRTVETHLRHIRTTLGLRSRAHVAAWAAERRVSTAAIA